MSSKRSGKKTTQFQLGDRVAWSSQAGGIWKNKLGTIVEVVSLRTRPQKADGAGTRDHESYVVQVDHTSRSGRTKKPQFYWPVVSSLKRVRKAVVVLEGSVRPYPTGVTDPGGVASSELFRGDGSERVGLPAIDPVPPFSPSVAEMKSPTPEDYDLDVRDVRQLAVALWAVECFGEAQAQSVPQRALRLLEEAIEAAQAAAVEERLVHDLVMFVYGRPVGELAQEVAGVSVTLLALAAALGVSADLVERTEVVRVLGKPRDFFTQRNAAKNEAGFKVVP